MVSITQNSEKAAGTSRPWLTGPLIWLVLLTAGILSRGWHVDSPFDHPDEPIAVKVNQALDQTWDTNWKRAPGMPPSFTANQYNFSGYHYAVHAWAKLTAPLMPAKWREEREGVVILRCFSVLCSALCMVWAFRLGNRFGGAITGWGAAVFTLVNPQLVADAHYARAEAMLTWLALVVVDLSIDVGRKPARWRWLVAAGVAGFCTSTKITLGLIGVAPALAACWAQWDRSGDAWRILPLLLEEGLVGVAFGAGFLAGVPGAVIHPSVYLEGVTWLANQYGGHHVPHNEFDRSRVIGATARFYWATLGAATILAMLPGVWMLGRKYRRETLMLVGLVAFYVGYFAIQRVFFERNISHVLPLAMVLAGAGVGLGAKWLGGGRERAAGLVAAALIVAGSFPAVRWSWLLNTQSFSATDRVELVTFEHEVKARFPQLREELVALLDKIGVERLESDFLVGTEPRLIRYMDFGDSTTAHYLVAFEKTFTYYEVGRWRTALTELPISGLRVYHGNSLTYVVVTGLKVKGPVTKP